MFQPVVNGYLLEVDCQSARLTCSRHYFLSVSMHTNMLCIIFFLMLPYKTFKYVKSDIEPILNLIVVYNLTS